MSLIMQNDGISWIRGTLIDLTRFLSGLPIQNRFFNLSLTPHRRSLHSVKVTKKDKTTTTADLHMCQNNASHSYHLVAGLP